MIYARFAIALAAVATASGVFASPSQLTDSQFLEVARCDGLAASKSLGTNDASAFDAILQAEGVRRSPDVTDRADEARADALRQASHAGPTGRQALLAEHDGVCQTFLRGSGASSSSGGGSHANAH